MEQDQRPAMPPIWKLFSLTVFGESSIFAAEEDLAFVDNLPPVVVQGQRLIRMFAHHSAYFFLKRGLTRCISYGAGVPEQGYVHQILGPDARIVYNDISPDVVAASQEFIANYPNVIYTSFDARKPQPILDIADHHFGGNRLVSLDGCGLFYFWPDEVVIPVLSETRDWCKPGSVIAITNFDAPKADRVLSEAKDRYDDRGLRLYPRSIEHMDDLLRQSGWEPIEGGLAPVEDQIARLRGDNFKKILEDPSFAGRVGSAGFYQRM